MLRRTSVCYLLVLASLLITAQTSETNEDSEVLLVNCGKSLVRCEDTKKMLQAELDQVKSSLVVVGEALEKKNKIDDAVGLTSLNWRIKLEIMPVAPIYDCSSSPCSQPLNATSTDSLSQKPPPLQLKLQQEELKLTHREIDILTERNHVCEASLSGEQSRLTTCNQDLELSQITVASCNERVATAERTVKETDCSAVRKELRTFKELSEQLKEDNALLTKRLTTLEATASKITELKERAEAAENSIASAEANAVKARAEADATQALLDKLLASLDAKEQYEQLLLQHQNELLPYWLQQVVWRRITGVGIIAYNVLNLKTKPGYQTASAAVSNAASVAGSLKETANKVWLLRIAPALKGIDSQLTAKFGDKWNATKTHTVEATQFMYKEGIAGAAMLKARALKAQTDAEKLILRKMNKVDALKPVAKPVFVHYGLLSIIAAITIPLVLAPVLRLLRYILWKTRPGVATVKIPASGSDYNALESKLGYQFQHDTTFKAVFKSSSARLPWLGAHVLRLLAAEKQWEAADGGDDTKTFTQLEGDVKSMLTESELVKAAEKAGIAQYVDQGPGKKSEVKAQELTAELFAATIAAVYVDSKFDIKAARKVVTSAANSSTGKK